MLTLDIKSKKLFLNLLIAVIPISFIAGNLILNLNLLIIIIFSLIKFRLEVFKPKLNLIDKLIIIFFLYVFLNGVYNNFFNFDFEIAPQKNIILIKSISYLRFLILYFVIKFLIQNRLINFKIIFISFGLCSLLVSFDIIFQKFFGQDIFGFKGTERRLAGPFGDEYIAGSFIQRFFIFLPFCLLLFFNYKKKYFTELIFIFVLVVCLLGILFSGNRMPMVLIFLIIGLLFLFEKKFRRSLFLFVFISVVGLIPLINSYDVELKIHYKVFTAKSLDIIDYLKIKVTNQKLEKLHNSYVKEAESGILTWKQNKIFGGGVKSFYFNCSNIRNSPMDKYGGTNCNMHPHNYYLELASELGLVGLILVSSIFTYIILSTFQTIRFNKNNLYEKKILICLFIIFIVEIFPIKTTGSFFTTTNATFLFIILSFIVSLNNYKKKG